MNLDQAFRRKPEDIKADYIAFGMTRSQALIGLGAADTHALKLAWERGARWDAKGNILRAATTHREFARSNGEFVAACELAGISPTPRQASKFRNGWGKAYDAAEAARRAA